jgi:thioredoxin 1
MAVVFIDNTVVMRWGVPRSATSQISVEGAQMATQELTSQTFNSTVADNELVFVDFWATWCGPCKAFGPIYDKASEKNADIVFGKVDIDQNQELAAAADIQAVPTLMVTKNGQVIFKQAGALRASDLDNLIEQAKQADVPPAQH